MYLHLQVLLSLSSILAPYQIMHYYIPVYTAIVHGLLQEILWSTNWSIHPCRDKEEPPTITYSSYIFSSSFSLESMHSPITLPHPILSIGCPSFRKFIQLDWPWIAEWAYAGIFAVAVQFQNQDDFWISHQKNQGSFFSIFFSKSWKMSSYGKKTMFLAILAKIRSFSNNCDM